jgi:hypothetical protein
MIASPLWLLGAFLSTADAASLLAREPLTVQEIRSLAAPGDLFALELLEAALGRRLTLRSRFAGGVVPPVLDDEIAAALEGIETLEPEVGSRRAREVLAAVASRSSPAFAARGILARSGEPAVIREGLARYFEDPPRWGRVLGEAARAEEDPRLMDFLALAGPGAETIAPAQLTLRLERNLVRSASFANLPAALQTWGGERSAARILSLVPASPAAGAAVNRRLAELALSARETRTRLYAIAGLGRRRAVAQKSVLLALVSDEEPVAAALACRALGALGDPSVRSALLDAFEGAGEPLATEIVTALAGLGGREEARRLAGLGRSYGFQATVALLDALQEEDRREAERVLGRLAAGERLRAVRFLAEKDSRLVLEAPVGEAEANALSTFFARSSFRSVRELVRRATGEAQGPALAALLLSSRATLEEKERAAREFGDAWWAALAEGGPGALAELERLALSAPELAPEPKLARLLDRLPDRRAIAALSLIPGPRARQALLDAGRPEALEALVLRPDRALGLPGLARLAREDEGELRAAAERALLRLDAPGALTLVQTKLQDPEALGALLPVLASSPAASEALAVLADRPGPAPALAASLFTFSRRDAEGFRRLLSQPSPRALDRFYATLSLTGDRSRLPVLLDEASAGPTWRRRRMAFRALAEADLERFASRLHRLAGDRNRETRFETAVALAPGGEPWTIRLLAAELQEDDPIQLSRARRAVERAPAAAVRPLLEDMVSEGTATAFTVLLLLDSPATEPGSVPRSLRRQAWQLLAPQVERSSLALLAASRLGLPPAIRAVLERLRALP